jgi:hypothetical protein
MAHTVEYQTIDLRGRIPIIASIEFLSAEVPVGPFRAPFAVVKYALNGEEQSLGLRLDLDKGVFLDHFERDHFKENILRHAAPQIVTAVYEDMFGEGQGDPSATSVNKPLYYPRERGPERWIGGAEYVEHREPARIFMCSSPHDFKWAGIFKEHLERTLRPEQVSEFQWMDASRPVQESDLLQRPQEVPSIILVLISQDLADSDIVRSNKLHRILERAERMGTKIVSIVLDPVPRKALGWLAGFSSVNDSSRALSLIGKRQKDQIFDMVTEIVEDSLKG